MTTIEKLARAMAAGDSGPEGSVLFDIHWKEFAEGYTKGAHACLTALLEPSKVMINAGIDAAEAVEDWTQDSYSTYRVDHASDMPFPVFTAMIRAALKEK